MYNPRDQRVHTTDFGETSYALFVLNMANYFALKFLVFFFIVNDTLLAWLIMNKNKL